MGGTDKKERENEKKKEKRNKKKRKQKTKEVETIELDYHSSQSCDTIILEHCEENRPDIVGQMEQLYLPRLERTYATAGMKINSK